MNQVKRIYWTKNCYLAGIVTGTPEKAKKWKSQYDLKDKNIYHYGNFDSISDNDDIDIVYVVLPNSMHHEYVIRAAKAGKHVICEKPMAISVKECQEMIDACKKAGVRLSIGYRHGRRRCYDGRWHLCHSGGTLFHR